MSVRRRGRPKFSVLERRLLAIIHPTGSVATGTMAGDALHRRGFVELTRGGERYQITAAGAEAIQRYPEGSWKIPQVSARSSFRHR